MIDAKLEYKFLYFNCVWDLKTDCSVAYTNGVFFGVLNHARCKEEVCILVSKEIRSFIKSHKFDSARVSWVRFKIGLNRNLLVSAHGPTESSICSEKERFVE